MPASRYIVAFITVPAQSKSLFYATDYGPTILVLDTRFDLDMNVILPINYARYVC